MAVKITITAGSNISSNLEIWAGSGGTYPTNFALYTTATKTALQAGYMFETGPYYQFVVKDPGTTCTPTGVTTDTLYCNTTVDFVIEVPICVQYGSDWSGITSIGSFTGGGGIYEATSTWYSSAALALAGSFTPAAYMNYTQIPSGTWWVAVRDIYSIGNSVAKSFTVYCIPATTTTTTSTTTTTTPPTTTTTTTLSYKKWKITGLYLTPNIGQCGDSTLVFVYTSPGLAWNFIPAFYLDSGLSVLYTAPYWDVYGYTEVGTTAMYECNIDTDGTVNAWTACPAPTTVAPPTTTTTTTIASYVYYITNGSSEGCGYNVGTTLYYAAESSPVAVSAFYTGSNLAVKWSPGAGTIGWSMFAGPSTYAAYEGTIDGFGNVSITGACA